MQTVSGRVGSSLRVRHWARLRLMAEERDDVPGDVPGDLPEGPADGPVDAQESVAGDDVALPVAGMDVQPDRAAKRILLVEDDSATQDVYQRILRYGGIMAISANISDENQAHASDLGLAAYFRKPFPPLMVLEAVQRLFGMTEES